MVPSYKYLNCALFSISSFITCVLLIINPERFIVPCILLFAATLAINGIAGVAFYYKNKQGNNRLMLAMGISQLSFALLFLTASSVLAPEYNKVKIFISLMFMTIAALYSVKLVKNIKNKAPVLTPSVCVILTFASLFVIIFYPFAQGFMWRFMALSIALQGILYIYVNFGSRAFQTYEKLDEINEEK